jgi:hypothetical protein
MKPTLVTLIFLAAIAFVAFFVIGRKNRSAVHSRNIPARTAHLSKDAISVVKLSPVTSKCTTCGHFKVHHFGWVFSDGLRGRLARR